MTLLRSKMMMAAVAAALAGAHGLALADAPFDPPRGPPADRGVGAPGFVEDRVMPPGLAGALPPGLGGPNPAPESRGFDCPTGGDEGEQGDRGNAPFNPCPGATLFGPVGRSGHSPVAHVEFAPAESPAEGEDGPAGRMIYFWIGPRLDFVFNAHVLAAGSEWTLVVDAGGGGVICLAGGAANEEGDLHLLASLDPDSHLPIGLDPFVEPGADQAETDAQVSLLPAVQVDCDTGALTPPAAGDEPGLFGAAGIRFVDTDVLVCPTTEGG
ncbi:MAG TPA: hypothetical protein VFG21_06955 [Xanthomonadaceae bacterium]|nr:hypothetical protein [Xanthomonadaceae bacterium]